MDNIERESVLFKLVEQDDWQAIDAIDSFIYIFDRMPKAMKLTVDLKMSGLSNKEIAQMLKISLRTIERRLASAKKFIASRYFG